MAHQTATKLAPDFHPLITRLLSALRSQITG